MADDAPVQAFIAVGSNIEPEHHIRLALEQLARHVTITGLSTFYRTPPLHRPEQPTFINGVVRIETAIPARALKFEVLRTVESRLGRVRTVDKYAPRTIDLDIVLYGSQVIAEPDLRIPDPDLRARPFLAVPLLELELCARARRILHASPAYHVAGKTDRTGKVTFT